MAFGDTEALTVAVARTHWRRHCRRRLCRRRCLRRLHHEARRERDRTRRNEREVVARERDRRRQISRVKYERRQIQFARHERLRRRHEVCQRERCRRAVQIGKVDNDMDARRELHRFRRQLCLQHAGARLEVERRVGHRVEIRHLERRPPRARNGARWHVRWHFHLEIIARCQHEIDA